MIYDVLCNHQIFRLLLKSKIVNQYSIFKLDYKHLTLWTDTNHYSIRPDFVPLLLANIVWKIFLIGISHLLIGILSLNAELMSNSDVQFLSKIS